MPGFEILLIVALIAGTALGAGALYAALSRTTASDTRDALADGEFERAMEAAPLEGDVETSRTDELAAAIAAKHLLRFDTAETRLRKLIEEDPGDAEAWLERGLVAAYDRRWGDAESALEQAARLRSDLLEPITLHRAWIALGAGDRSTARRYFEDVETPLENKLRTDIGGGDPLFAEWFWHASVLWRDAGDTERADWAWSEGCDAAPKSQLPKRIHLVT